MPASAAPALAIETAERWSRHEATEADCREAEAAVHAAVHEAHTHHISDLRAHAASIAAAATAYAPRAARDAVQAAATARALSVGEGSVENIARHLDDLLALVRVQRWPKIVPTAEQLQRAAAAITTAWEAVSAIDGDHTVVELVEARLRAERVGLAWRDPVQRAIAERASDEAQLWALLVHRM